MLSDDAVLEFTDPRSRRWKVYSGGIASMGEHIHTSDTFYWDLLGKTAENYLGSKKIVYIKVFGLKNGDNITAECRVDDVISSRLGEILYNSVSGWKNKGITSHKQFFFMVCEDMEVYPYSQEQISEYVKKTVELFCKEEENYDNIHPALSKIVGDKNLADELRFFIPEICAGWAFEVPPEDEITVNSGKESVKYTKWQISSFNMITFALRQGFDNGEYPDEEAYRKCILPSSTLAVIEKAKKQKEKLVEIRHIYNFHEGYVVR